jgi:hypothetical protein
VNSSRRCCSTWTEGGGVGGVNAVLGTNSLPLITIGVNAVMGTNSLPLITIVSVQKGELEG